MTSLAGKVTFLTSTMNTRWTAYSQALLAVGFPGCRRVVVDAGDAWTPLFFLPWLERIETDYVVLVDEDCFILEPAQLERLIAELDAQPEIALAGTPDGGTFHRHYNPLACNTFFLVVRRSSALEALAGGNASFEDIRALAAADHLAQLDEGRFGWSLSEPYYPFFWKVLATGQRIRYLMPEVEPGTKATAVSIGPAAKPMLLHMWWLRDWWETTPNPYLKLSHRSRYDRLEHEWLAPRFASPRAAIALASQRLRTLVRRVAGRGRKEQA